MMLTKRESEVARLIALDYTYAEVAESLEISPETVASHVQNAAKKIPGTARPVHKLKVVVFQAVTAHQT